jgi:hypothetical protein
MYDPFGHPLAAGRTRRRHLLGDSGRAISGHAVTFTILSETTLTAFAAFDNTVMASTHDAQPANTVYFDSPLAVGTDYVGPPPGYETIQAASAVLFDVQSQIAGRNIVRATLRLFVHTPRGDLSVTPLVRVSAFASLWNPATLTWNAWQTMQVQATGTAVQDAPPSPAIPADFDVTTIVRNWASSTWNNYGLQIDPLNHSYPGGRPPQTDALPESSSS